MDPHVLKHMREGTTPSASDGDGSRGRNPIPRKEQSESAKAALESLGRDALAAGAFQDGQINYDQVREVMFWQTMTRLPQVTICLVEGSVMGTGLNIISCVDMTIALKSACFCMEEAKRYNLVQELADDAKHGHEQIKTVCEFCTQCG